jgi:hypothetical protein
MVGLIGSNFKEIVSVKETKKCDVKDGPLCDAPTGAQHTLSDLALQFARFHITSFQLSTKLLPVQVAVYI